MGRIPGFAYERGPEPSYQTELGTVDHHALYNLSRAPEGRDCFEPAWPAYRDRLGVERLRDG